MTSSKKIVIILVAVVVAAMGFVMIRGGKDAATGSSQAKTYKAVRRNMTVNVVENGTIESVNAFIVRSQVEGSTTIIGIIPEGEIVTQEDIDNKRILVELDSSGLREKISQQEITYNSAMASLTEAKESLDIQRNQNDSDIQKAMLTVQFALMDLQKYFGEGLALEVIGNDIYETDALEIVKLVHNENIAGEALQKKRELQSNIDLRMEELERAEYDLYWTQQLADKDYVAASDLKADQLKVKRLEVDVERAETNLVLFEKYEFAKQARKLLSDYKEAKRELERTEARSRSRLAQSIAKLNSQEATFNLQKERFEKLRDQIDACIIYAQKPGMVVYASDSNRWGQSRTNIETGASVRERQDILTIPDSSRMAVNIKVHESSIDRIKLGQRAQITIDAIPGTTYNGAVSRIAPLPDPQNFMANPDMKVYSTQVTIDGHFSNLRPGMSAKVDVIVEQLEDVLIVPLQCVATRGGRKVAYVWEGGRVVAKEVKTGSYNDSFVQIIDGISVGDEVLLTPPRIHHDGNDTRTTDTTPTVAAQPPQQNDEQSPPQSPKLPPTGDRERAPEGAQRGERGQRQNAPR